MINQVLCIEDDAITQMLCKTVIKKTSFARKIVTASNGQSAIEYYDNLMKGSREEKKAYPRVILLDLNMPVMGGWEFLDVFVDNYLPTFTETRVAIVSSVVDPEEIKMSSRYPIVKGVIPKPISTKAINYLKTIL